MKHRLKKWVLCLCVMTMLWGFSSYAAEQGETFPIKTEETDNANSNNEEKGNLIKERLEKWFTRDDILKIAAGFGAGLGLALIVFAAVRFVSKSEVRKQKDSKQVTKEEQKMPGYIRDSEVTERVSESLVREDGIHMEVFPASQMPSMPDASKGTIGTVHHIGSRQNQQDTFGINLTQFGLLVIVSDGMGGLFSGDKVSQKAVMGMLQAGNQLMTPLFENPLFEMLGSVNGQVLEMLGPELIYKSGATLLAAMVKGNQFHWIAVGDSRIYFYCSGHLFQINREHVYKQQLLQEAVNQNISFLQVNTDPQRNRLVSFLGMGELKFIDGSLRPMDVKKGDKLLLMSDGIFNTISEQEIMGILEGTKNAAEAAALMEKRIIGAANPKQDNFTCVILDF